MTPCRHGLAEQCKVALSGALLSLAAAVFMPYNSPALASGASILSPDVPVVSVQCSVLLYSTIVFGTTPPHTENTGIDAMPDKQKPTTSVVLCKQLDLAKLVPSGQEQGLEDKLRGLQE